MKTIAIQLVIMVFGTTVLAQNIAFVDANLKAMLLTENCVDTDNDNIPDSDADFNNDNEIQLSEALSITSLKLGSFPDTFHIASVEDLRHFSNLEKLTVIYFGNLERFELLGLTNLTDLYIGTCAILKHIDISDLPNIVNQGIEDIAALDYLNMQNNNFPSGTFSLFYSENIQFACIDDTLEEYAAVEYNMAAGMTPSVNCALGVAAFVAEDEVQLFPNPTANFITIRTKNPNVVALSIVDVSGRIIKEYSQNFTCIEVSSLKQGLYFVNVQLSNNQNITKKLIKK